MYVCMYVCMYVLISFILIQDMQFTILYFLHAKFCRVFFQQELKICKLVSNALLYNNILQRKTTQTWHMFTCIKQNYFQDKSKLRRITQCKYNA